MGHEVAASLCCQQAADRHEGDVQPSCRRRSASTACSHRNKTVVDADLRRHDGESAAFEGFIERGPPAAGMELAMTVAPWLTRSLIEQRLPRRDGSCLFGRRHQR